MIASLAMSSLCEMRGGLHRTLGGGFQVMLDFRLWLERLCPKIKTDSRNSPSDGLASKAMYL